LNPFYPSLQDLKKSRKYYDREINALTAIHKSKHSTERIIPLVQYGEDEDSAYIFTPYLHSGTLHDYVQAKGGLQELEALEVLEQVVDGAQVIHKAGYTHSDLKVGLFEATPTTKGGKHFIRSRSKEGHHI
jgi:serine/threonine protein kinase